MLTSFLKGAKNEKNNNQAFPFFFFSLQERKEGVWAGGGSGPAEGPGGSAPLQGCQPQHLPEWETKPGGWGEWPEGPAGQGESLGLRGRSGFWFLIVFNVFFKRRMSSSENPLRFFFFFISRCKCSILSAVPLYLTFKIIFSSSVIYLLKTFLFFEDMPRWLEVVICR